MQLADNPRDLTGPSTFYEAHPLSRSVTHLSYPSLLYLSLSRYTQTQV